MQATTVKHLDNVATYLGGFTFAMASEPDTIVATSLMAGNVYVAITGPGGQKAYRFKGTPY